MERTSLGKSKPLRGRNSGMPLINSAPKSTLRNVYAICLPKKTQSRAELTELEVLAALTCDR
jgi:hypothetical protein